MNELKQKFKSISDDSPEGKRLMQKSVLSIVMGEYGKVYLGTDGGGVHIFDPQTNTVRVLNHGSLAQVGGVIKSMALSKANTQLWMGTYNKGAFVYHLKDQKVQAITMAQDNKTKGLTRNDVCSIYSDEYSNIWLGLLGKGVQLYSPLMKEFKSLTIADSSTCNDLFRSSIFSLMKDSRNRLWMITEYNGAYIYDLNNKTFKHLYQYPNGKGLPSNDLRDVWEDANGDIWLGSVNVGLIKIIDIEDEVYKVYGTKEGLNTVQVVGILHDRKNNIWVSTDKGISVLDSKANQFRNFDEEDGLSSKAYNYNSKLLAPDGTMYFGGIGGLTYFHPSSITINNVKPPVVITDFKIFNHTIFPKQKLHDRIILQNAIYRTDEIELDYSDNVITLEFAALDYTSPKKALYAYKLEGFDEDWIYVDANHRLVTYTNLDPGTYKFAVKASNNDGVWNEIGNSVEILVNPPWWKTWWFRLIISVLFMLLVFVFYKLRVQSIEEKNRQLQLELAICQQELKKQQKIKDKFYTIITQDLKNPITSLFGLTHMLSNDLKKDYVVKEGDEEMIGHVAKMSKRIKDLILDLLDWTKTQQSEIVQHKVLVDVYGLVDDTIDYLRTQSVSKKIIIANSVWKGVMVEADKQILTKVFHKIIGNAIKYTPEEGIIIITPSLEDNEVCISVKDTGIGMTQDEVDRILQGDYHYMAATGKERGSGIGLMVSYEFIYLMNGRLNIESTLGEGTTFHIYLPIHSILNASLVPNRLKSEFIFIREVLGKQVLVVDDTISNRIQLTKKLQPYFNVRSVEKVEDIDVLIRLYAPDIILYHSTSLEDETLDICKKIKSNFVSSHIPLLLISDVAQVSNSQDNYFDGYIEHREEMTPLFEMINSILFELKVGKVTFYHNPYAPIPNKLIRATDQAFVKQVVSYLQQHMLSTNLTVSQIASDLSYNHHQFIGKVYGILGLTVLDLLNLIRVNKSMELLKSKENTPYQVTFMVGFSDLNHFTRVFIQFTGLHPKDFQ